MSDLIDKSIKKIHEGLINKDFSCVELCSEALEKSKKTKSSNAYITLISDEIVLKQAKEKDRLGLFNKGILDGIPFSMKDVFVTKDIKTTAGSKVLGNYKPQYNATVYSKVLNSGGILIGKTNQDAWGHGGSSENTDFGPVKNPWDETKSAGGSSGGSAVSVVDRTVGFSIAEDTGGSIRNPASWCGVTGLKVTYGRVSRYGSIAYASSFDTVGPIAKSVEDISYVMEIIAGKDVYDATSSDVKVLKYSEFLSKKTKYKFALPKEFFDKGLDKEVLKSILGAVSELKKMGHEFIEIDFPIFEYAVPLYYIIGPSETSSNLGRYDGVRYGNMRDKFTDETKRRIMMGTYALSAGYADKFYLSAQRARALLVKAYNNVFAEVDFIISPVMPTTATQIGELLDDPVRNWLADVYTVTQNPAGIPSLALPTGFSKKNMPIGMQIIGPMFSEEKLLNIGHQYQEVTDWHTKKPRI